MSRFEIEPNLGLAGFDFSAGGALVRMVGPRLGQKGTLSDLSIEVSEAIGLDVRVKLRFGVLDRISAQAAGGLRLVEKRDESLEPMRAGLATGTMRPVSPGTISDRSPLTPVATHGTP